MLDAIKGTAEIGLWALAAVAPFAAISLLAKLVQYAWKVNPELESIELWKRHSYEHSKELEAAVYCARARAQEAEDVAALLQKRNAELIEALEKTGRFEDA